MARMACTFGLHAWLARLARLARMARWLAYWQLSRHVNGFKVQMLSPDTSMVDHQSPVFVNPPSYCILKLSQNNPKSTLIFLKNNPSVHKASAPCSHLKARCIASVPPISNPPMIIRFGLNPLWISSSITCITKSQLWSIVTFCSGNVGLYETLSNQTAVFSPFAIL